MLPAIPKSSLFFLSIIIPLTVGGLIYLFWRPDSLLMFMWIEHLGLSDSLFLLRESFSNYQLPKGVLYNLPNGTWTYSFTVIMTYIWLGPLSLRKYFFILLPLFLGVSFEIGQYMHIIPGTYCFGDVLAHLFGAILGYIVIKLLIKRRVLNASQ